jgi:hypothetical protein
MRRALLAAALACAMAVVPLPAQDASRLRVSVIGQAALVRSARIGFVAPEREVALRGVDAEYWVRTRGRGPSGAASREGLGFAMRAHQSSLGGDDLRYYDVSALYGLGALIERFSGAGVRDAIGDLSAELAFGGQAGYELATGALHGETHDFARLGLRAASRVAMTPLSLEARLSRYLAFGGPDGADGLSGFDGETAARWSFQRLPVDVALGYRFGRLRVYRTAQEVSALRLELGWRGLR